MILCQYMVTRSWSQISRIFENNLSAFSYIYKIDTLLNTSQFYIPKKCLLTRLFLKISICFLLMTM